MPIITPNRAEAEPLNPAHASTNQSAPGRCRRPRSRGRASLPGRRMACRVRADALRVDADRVRIPAGQPADADRDRPPHQRGPGRSGDRGVRDIRGADQPVHRFREPAHRSPDAAAGADRPDAGLGSDRRLRAEFSRPDDRASAPRRSNRRFLVDVDGDSHAPCPEAHIAARPRVAQRRQCACDHDRRAAWQLPRTVYRLARRLLLRGCRWWRSPSPGSLSHCPPCRAANARAQMLSSRFCGDRKWLRACSPWPCSSWVSLPCSPI